ncbi:MAG: phosphopantothenoylcysteine decarboxylase [Chitinophagales bacterium]|nr:phosphopantothenoylcysteine decarboxylase [Chitinophagales bacterium]MDW8419990.1 flavoprotein [Chitinophagales bacterium]
MNYLQHKKIVLGVCGSIAAYKAAFLTRLLIKHQAEVRVIMTRSAAEFITPLTFSTLSRNEVYTDFTNGAHAWHSHVEMGLWADAMVIAPASANTIAKMAQAVCDNLLLATYLSARCPVFFAPAMDLDMWKHKAVRRNIELLHSYGNILIPVEDGELASGLSGEGRMAEPEHIIQHLQEYFRI